MGEKAEIPCANCQSWAKKEKKFTCNPDECKGLTTWLIENAPQINKDDLKVQVRLPVSANQYIV